MNYNFTKFIESNFAKKALSKIVLSVLLIAGFSFTASSQYCVPGYIIGCSSQDDINSFTLTGQVPSVINDLNTGCGSGNGYEDRTMIVPAVDLMQGGTYNGTVTTDFSSGESYRIWIDFNDNDTFDVTEALTGNVGPFGSFTPSNYSITIPLSAPIGIHRMRVRLVFSQAPLIDPCASNLYTFGEAHDYLVNVLAAPPCMGTPLITGVTPAGPISSCAGASQTLTVNLPIAGGYNFQWQQSTNGGTSWNNVGTNSTTYNFTVTGNALYQIIVTCTNTNLADTSNIVSVSAAPPTYVSIPYFQDFETWTNYCDNFDIPSGASTNWTNNPATGDNSWRRDDQGSTANWSNTFGTYFPSSISGLHSARFPSAAALGGVPGNLDLYLDCSTQTGNKQLYFYNINDGSFFSGDSLTVWLSTNGGSSFSQIGSFDTAINWKRHTLPIISNSAQTILRFQGMNLNFDFTDIGLDSVYVAPPCTGAPAAGNIVPNGPITGCPGNTFVFNTSGTTLAGNLTYQWQQSINNGVTWTNVAGNNTITFTTPPLLDTIRYRFYVVCNGSGLSDTSTEVVLNIASPIYASLPYSEGFESWMNYCDISDVPSLNWLNNPATADNSWRREDEGGTANWFSPTMGAYAPASIEGSHSARFHSSSFFLNFNDKGNLSLFVDCSGAGNKELQFYYINPTGFDSLLVELSTNNGASYTTIDTLLNATNWTLNVIPVVSTSAQTVIRFRAISDFSDDIGIDYVRVLLPCAGAPVAGNVDSLSVCSGQDFHLSLTGTTASGALTYVWQESANGTTWTNVPGGNVPIATTNITTPTYYRAIVTCSISGLSDTSDPVLFTIAPFYYCYCQSAAQLADDDDIGNFSIRKYPLNQFVFNNGFASPLINNPNANNTYTNYTNLPPIPLFKDSIYKFFVTQINQNSFFPSDVAIYLDMNHDGVFDPFAERIFLKTTSNTSAPSQQVSDTFRIPGNTQIGITGLRVVLVENGFSFVDPCISYLLGETEDYLAFVDFPPCTGPTNAGVASISDTLLCPGYNVTLVDTSHEHFRSGITWIWQSSPDNVNWTDIAGSTGVDTLVQVTGSTPLYYRLQMKCNITNSLTYSNVVHINIKPTFQCYCESFADGGANDVSDVGAFSIGNFITNTGGPHLNNPTAVKSYTTYAGPGNVVALYTDSTYNLSVYHTMSAATHQDAKVTLFMDFNNNFIYDTPDELVWTGFTTSSNIFINSTVTIPGNAVTDVLTGMRLIINNDIGPNVPSDQACGPYTSGETEDYVVKFKVKGLGIAEVNELSEFTLFPNPTTGKVTVKFFNNNTNKTLRLRVSTVTGQEIYYKEYYQPGKDFSTEIDLGGRAKGIYFVELASDKQKAIKKLILR